MANDPPSPLEALGDAADQFGKAFKDVMNCRQRVERQGYARLRLMFGACGPEEKAFETAQTKVDSAKAAVDRGVRRITPLPLKP
jgi:hypothetical protein